VLKEEVKAERSLPTGGARGSGSPSWDGKRLMGPGQTLRKRKLCVAEVGRSELCANSPLRAEALSMLINGIDLRGAKMRPLV
jgi:hypothetical protein